MNTMVSASALATATAVVAPSVASAASTTVDTVSFPGLIARFIRFRERWRNQRALDQVRQDEFDDLFFKASGFTKEQRLAIGASDPRWKEMLALMDKIAAEIRDYDLVDEHGRSIAWNALIDEIWPLADEILGQTPRTIADLAWQAEALTIADVQLLEPGSYPSARLLRNLLANIRTLSGPLSLPSAVSASAPSDPLFAAIEAHKAAVATFLQAIHINSELQESLPRNLRQSMIRVDERKIVETDDPRWIEAEDQVIKTGDAMNDAATTILNLELETIDGAIALLRYMTDHMDRYDGQAMGWPEDLLPDGVNPDDAKWNSNRSAEYFVMQNVAAALERLHGGPAKPPSNIAA